MREVGIFTIYICNYGAVLQAYALKKCIENMFKDIKVSIVDFYSHKHYRIFSVSAKNPIKKLIKYGLILTHYRALCRRNKREIVFIKEEFNLSKRFDNVDILLKEMPTYDYYLTGSDQVFNSNAKYSPLFFQQFEIGSGIKAAYAPSFGQSAFTSDQWSKMMKVPKTNEKYMLVYDLNGGVPMLSVARKIAAEKGLKIYCITRHPDNCFIYRGIDKVIYDAGPREFVGYFSHASYVITDSFHGTAFSLIFHKNFNTFIAVLKSSQRIKSLLETCGLLNRIIGNGEPTDFADNCAELFNEQAFAEYRQSSFDYLTEIFR